MDKEDVMHVYNAILHRQTQTNKKNEFLPLVTTCMGLEYNAKQNKSEKYCMISLLYGF